MFRTPTVRNKSEIGYVECLSQGRVAESFLNEGIGTSESDQEFEAEADIVSEGASHDYTGATLKDMYTVGLTFTNILRGLTPDWYPNWPPFAYEFTARMLRKWYHLSYSILLHGFLGCLTNQKMLTTSN